MGKKSYEKKQNNFYKSLRTMPMYPPKGLDDWFEHFSWLYVSGTEQNEYINDFEDKIIKLAEYIKKLRGGGSTAEYEPYPFPPENDGKVRSLCRGNFLLGFKAASDFMNFLKMEGVSFSKSILHLSNFENEFLEGWSKDKQYPSPPDVNDYLHKYGGITKLKQMY